MYILGMILLIFFAVIGLSCFISMIAKANLKSDTGGFILLIPEVDADNAEARIRSAAVIRQEAFGCRVVCVCPEDQRTRTICEKLQKEYPFLEIVDSTTMRGEW